MPEVNPDTPERLRALVASLCPTWTLAPDTAFQWLSGGLTNRNYAFTHAAQRYVLRVHAGAVSPEALARESRLLAADLPLPRPERISAFDSRGHALFRALDGPLLAELPVDPARRLRHFREVRRALNRLPWLAPRYRSPDLDALFRRPQRLPRVVHRAWEQRAAGARSMTLALCHNDLNPWNVVAVTSGNWVTLDWQTLGMNDSLFDLLALYWDQPLTPAAFSGLATRALGRPVPVDRLLAVWRHYWLREFAFAEWRLRRHRQPLLIAQRARALSRLTGL